MILQVSDIYIRSILLFSIAGFCSQPQARDAQYKSRKRATTSAAAINKHCSLKRSKGLRHLLLCIFLHPVISAEAKGMYLAHRFSATYFCASFFILSYRARKKISRSASPSFCNLLMTDNSKRPRSVGTGPFNFLKYCDKLGSNAPFLHRAASSRMLRAVHTKVDRLCV